jgi:catechol 2,3-dioxygenase-like lactoylglutathione lyase family enzyme
MTLEIEGCTTLLEVFDMPTSVAFYRDLLGFELVAQSQPGERFDWGLLRRDHVEMMLNTAYEDDERPPEPDPVRVLAHRDTTLFFGCRDLDAAYAHFRARGLDVKPPETTSYGMKQLSIKDPDDMGSAFNGVRPNSS